ncbi:leukocyte elastase inhibitor-like [Brevipalpus obovatus]|uniref:leukocyte elastase inhibitor-like n=1 Tax=Brevipalpus obovatus TaxID=246614 RepID=UPI003D9DFF7B
MSQERSSRETRKVFQTPIDRFTVEFLRKVCENDNKNILVSPIGITVLYTIILEGARGKTAEQLMQVFHLKPQFENVEDVRIELEKVIKRLNQKDEGLILKMTNKVVMSEKFQLKPSFQKIVEENYSASIDQEDISKADVVTKKLNEWVSQETNNLIPQLFDEPLKPDDILVLINVLHFKGFWQVPFTEAKTSDGIFNNLDGTKSTVKMMCSSKPKYPSSNREDENLRIIKLPYIGTIAMFIIMPTGVDGLRELMLNLTAEKIENYLSNNWLAHFPSVRIPKFRLENTHDLRVILPSIGLNLPFSNSAEFTGISDDPLEISESIQRTFINVDEKGSEAVAAATTRMRIGCMRRMQMDSFVLDRPFMFFLRDRETRVNLFVGVVKKLPDEKSE